MAGKAHDNCVCCGCYSGYRSYYGRGSIKYQQCIKEIFAGIIIDKYTSGGYYVRGFEFPKAWNFVMQGTKDGETVNYRFEVTEEEYSRYKIGDYYER